LLVVIAAVAMIERSVDYLLFSIAALLFTIALMLVFVADFERALLLSGMLAVAIAGASVVKFKHSALKLTVSDLPLAFAGTVPFFMLQYPRSMLGVLIGCVLFAFALAAVLFYVAGSPISIAFRIALFCLAFIGFVKASAARGATSLRL